MRVFRVQAALLLVAAAALRVPAPRRSGGPSATALTATNPTINRRRDLVTTEAATFNEWGLSLKDKAKSNAEALVESPSKRTKAKLSVATAWYSGLFVAYRAYRGFCVVLPAVFGEVRQKLRDGRAEGVQGIDEDIDPATGKLKLRSAVLMNLGAACVVLALSVRALVVALFAVPKALAALLQRPTAGPPKNDNNGGAGDAAAARGDKEPPESYVVPDIPTA